MEKFYTIAFSKPLVREIGWSYGVSDEDSFILNGGILDGNKNPKLAYYALKNLQASWTSKGAGQTDEDGYFLMKGFGGDYQVTAIAEEGCSFTRTVHIAEQQQNEFTIALYGNYLPYITKNTGH